MEPEHSKKHLHLLIHPEVLEKIVELYTTEGKKRSLSIFIENILIAYLNDRGVIV